MAGKPVSYVKLAFEDQNELRDFFNAKEFKMNDQTKFLSKQKPNLNGLEGASNLYGLSGASEDFAKMLEMDKQVYKSLYHAWYNYHILYLKYKAMPGDNVNPTPGTAKYQERQKLLPLATELVRLYNSYNARQKEYRESTALKTSKAVGEWSDRLAGKLKDAWNSLSSLNGLGAVPALVPLAIIGGSVITASVAIIFVYKYYKSTQLDVEDANSLISNLYKIDAKTGAEVAKKIAGMYAEAGNGSNNPLSQIGSGVKLALVTGAFSVPLLYVANKAGVFDEIKKIFNNRKPNKRKK